MNVANTPKGPSPRDGHPVGFIRRVLMRLRPIRALRILEAQHVVVLSSNVAQKLR